MSVVGRIRNAAAIAAVVLMSWPVAVAAAPGLPVQEEEPDEAHAGDGDAMVDIEVDVADASAGMLTGTIAEIRANIEAQVAQLTAAQSVLSDAVNQLAERTTTVSETQLRLEELTQLMDEIVVSAFVMPPGQSALEVFNADSALDATLKQALLDMNANDNADVLTAHEETRELLEEQQDLQETAAAEAEAARTDAEAALADLQAAVDQQTEFILAVQARLADPATASDPELQAAVAALVAEIQGLQNAEAAALAAAELEQARQRAAEAEAAAAAAAPPASGGSSGGSGSSGGTGSIVCPVDGGGLHFTDTWGAARSGGRIHQGTDMLAEPGTPTLAPVSGEVVHRYSSLGGYSWYLYGDDGNTYYGTHLSDYANQGAGWVSAGTVIGYVGDSGNAAGTPHLHFEYHPGGGSPINPYSLLDASCPAH